MKTRHRNIGTLDGTFGQSDIGSGPGCVGGHAAMQTVVTGPRGNASNCTRLRVALVVTATNLTRAPDFGAPHHSNLSSILDPRRDGSASAPKNQGRGVKDRLSIMEMLHV